MRSKIIMRVTLEKTFKERDTLNQAVVRIVNKAASAWSIECLRYEIRDIIPPASITKAMECRRKPIAANVRDFAEVKETRRAKSICHDEDQQDWDSVEQQLSVQDPGAHALTVVYDVTSKESFNKEKVRFGEINKQVSDGINKLPVENECDLTSHR